MSKKGNWKQAQIIDVFLGVIVNHDNSKMKRNKINSILSTLH